MIAVYAILVNTVSARRRKHLPVSRYRLRARVASYSQSGHIIIKHLYASAQQGAQNTHMLSRY